jgi:hypothetical protein
MGKEFLELEDVTGAMLAFHQRRKLVMKVLKEKG